MRTWKNLSNAAEPREGDRVTLEQGDRLARFVVDHIDPNGFLWDGQDEMQSAAYEVLPRLPMEKDGFLIVHDPYAWGVMQIERLESEVKPGTIGVATVRGVKNVRVVRTYHDTVPWFSPSSRIEKSRWYAEESVTDFVPDDAEALRREVGLLTHKLDKLQQAHDIIAKDRDAHLQAVARVAEERNEARREAKRLGKAFDDLTEQWRAQNAAINDAGQYLIPVDRASKGLAGDARALRAEVERLTAVLAEKEQALDGVYGRLDRMQQRAEQAEAETERVGRRYAEQAQKFESLDALVNGQQIKIQTLENIRDALREEIKALRATRTLPTRERREQVVDLLIAFSNDRADEWDTADKIIALFEQDGASSGDLLPVVENLVRECQQKNADCERYAQALSEAERERNVLRRERDEMRQERDSAERAANAAEARTRIAEREVDRLRKKVLPKDLTACACHTHAQDAGAGFTEYTVEYEPACPIHSTHVYNPRTGQWRSLPDQVALAKAIGDGQREVPGSGTFLKEIKPEYAANRVIHLLKMWGL
jgi:hypothetical protein